jgi:hypothetical protein
MTNPAAVTWYGTLLQRAIDMGYDGWMLDFGEYVQPDVVAWNGMTGEELHNLFPVLYHRASHDALERKWRTFRNFWSLRRDGFRVGSGDFRNYFGSFGQLGLQPVVHGRARDAEILGDLLACVPDGKQLGGFPNFFKVFSAPSLPVRPPVDALSPAHGREPTNFFLFRKARIALSSQACHTATTQPQALPPA